MKHATTTIRNKLNLEGVDLELRTNNNSEKEEEKCCKMISLCIISLEDVPT